MDLRRCAWSMLVVGSVALVGCGAGQPPRELVDARSAYARAQAGPAKQQAPATLQDAKAELQKAERAHAASADVPNPRTLGYIAQRKSELAEVQARDSIDQQRKSDAEQKIELMSAPSTPSAAPGPSTTASDVLFAKGKSNLTTTAQTQLDAVAEALRPQPQALVVLSGHTDSVGSEASNERLSEQRTDAVKSYLISHGVDAERIFARRFGEAEPAASNDTAEGRATNRRVSVAIEIVPSGGKP
jgi:outer membrane protein OmpA-like peptidoglycan-associated protein